MNRRQYEITAADTNQNLSLSTKYVGYDPEMRQALLQDTEGNIFYGKADTNGAIARGGDIRLRRGYGLPGYDAMPCPKKKTDKPRKPVVAAPDGYYIVSYGSGFYAYSDGYGGGDTNAISSIEGSTKKIAVSTSIGFKDLGRYHTLSYFWNDGFIPLLALSTTVSIMFVGLGDIESAEFQIKINTAYSSEGNAIAYFVNKSNATIIASDPSPLHAYLYKNSNSALFNQYGDESYGAKEFTVELVATDFTSPPIEAQTDSKGVSFVLGSWMRAQADVFYGGVAQGSSASISHEMEIEIESINNRRLNLKRKILEPT